MKEMGMARRLAGQGPLHAGGMGGSHCGHRPVDGQDALLAYDWKGKERWRTTFAENAGRHRNGWAAIRRAVTDGQAFYVFFKSKTLAAVDFAGKIYGNKT